jgi:hypothetical protein
MALMGKLNGRLRIAVLERDGYRCVYCGRSSDVVPLNADHVVPRARGGRDDPANLVTACFDCNNGKRADLVALPAHVDPTRPLPSPAARRRLTRRPARVRDWRRLASDLGLQGPFPVGRYFVLEYDLAEPIGHLQRSYRQGVVVGLDGGVAWVRLFSQADGCLGEATVAYPVVDWHRWRFFETDRDLRRWAFEWGAGHGLWSGSESHWRQCEALHADIRGVA